MTATFNGSSAHPAEAQATASRFPPLRRLALTCLQVNLGYRCSHCNVNAGRTCSERWTPRRQL